MKIIIKINLIILVIFCLFFNSYVIATEPVIDGEETQDVEEQEQKEEKTLDDLQLEKSQLEEGLDNSNTKIEFVEEQLSKNIVEIAKIEQDILDKQMEIETFKAQETELLKYIEKAEKELEDSDRRYNTRKELLEKRLVAMYERGQVSYLDILFNSRNIIELISNYFLLEEIASADVSLLEEVSAELKYNKELKSTLEAKKLVLVASRQAREKNTIAAENLALIKRNKVNNLSEEEQVLHQMIEEYQKQIADIETEIRLLAIANVGKDYVGGTMAWPVPGYTRITSQFGMRTHPITGVYKLHTGVDIGAPMGTTFIAANDGLVTYAGENRAYGNMVIVNHGGGITTLYAHGSEILVNVGDYVMQGTPVLKVGSTGYSTGPHAHFEVRINGEYVQPLDYITSYNSNANDNKTNTVSNIVNNIGNELNNTLNTVNNVVQDEKQEEE